MFCPTIFDPTEASGQLTINIDDATGTLAGIPLATEAQAALTAAGLPLATPGRGANGVSGTSTASGAKVANTVQQQYFASAATQAVLPLLAQRSKPFHQRPDLEGRGAQRRQQPAAVDGCAV